MSSNNVRRLNVGHYQKPDRGVRSFLTIAIVGFAILAGIGIASDYAKKEVGPIVVDFATQRLNAVDARVLAGRP